MKTMALGNSKVVNLLFTPAGVLMGSKLRKWLMNPETTLCAAEVQSGQRVLEVGCGTGFFTLPAAQMVGDRGCVVALDVTSGFLKVVARKVQAAGLQNVHILRRDALATGLDSASLDKVLLFGVIPFPLLPLSKLLPEMHRVLRSGATLSVWLFPPLVHNWVPKAIAQSGLFHQTKAHRNVYNFVRLPRKAHDHG
ncbi:MAG: class I SAM-dependent methyltransferase [Desulfosarcinaceae bacterium]|nr:class I SAM-dependent methyltransferase [Desulfosarcinaceae bacterium]